MAGGKVGCFSAARLLLLSTAFIIVNELAGCVAEGRKCYWCGALAEQVHRSRRAPPCSGAAGDRLVTACDPGYDYCAVVATTPPYQVSRFCVKLYQDECYPLFCNSTKTWKMTCPCRGDLCNGINTEREDEAFMLLTKFFAKTQSGKHKRSAKHLAHIRSVKIVNPETEIEPLTRVYEEINAQDNIESPNVMVTTHSIDTAKSKESSTESIIRAKEESDVSVRPVIVKESDKNETPITPTMIEIDIKSSYITVKEDDHISTGQITMHEIDLQADEPVQQDGLAAIENETHEDMEPNRVAELEEIEPVQTTSELPKVHLVDVITINQSLSADNKSEDETGTTIVLKPTESIPEIPIQNHEIDDPEKDNPAEVQTQIPQKRYDVRTSTTERATVLSTKTTANTNTVTSKSASTNKTKSHKHNNDAIKLSDNILIIIQCILVNRIM